jgi:cytochrome c biogenesis protein CcdA
MAGAVTTVNPCGFALLPAYLARRLAGEVEPGAANAVARALGVGAVTTGGFVLVFGAAASALSFGAYWLMRVMPVAGFAIGLALIGVGIMLLTGRRISLDLQFLRPSPAPGRKSGMRGDFLFGAAYGTASLSCTLPVLLGITGTAMSGGVVNSAANFAAFALGMGTVFTALAVAATLSRDGLARRFKQTLPYINRVSGAMVTAAGLYVAYYWGFALFKPQVPGAYGIIMAGERLSATLRSWLGGEAGEIIVVGVFVALLPALAWSLWRRLTARSDTGDRSRGEPSQT